MILFQGWVEIHKVQVEYSPPRQRRLHAQRPPKLLRARDGTQREENGEVRINDLGRRSRY